MTEVVKAAEVTETKTAATESVTTTETKPAPGTAATDPAKVADPAATVVKEEAKTGVVPEAEKPAASTAVKPLVPEKYELALPKDSQLDSKHLEELTAFAKAKGLTQEQASETLARDNAIAAGVLAKQQANYQEQVSGWKSAVIADKEIGGESAKENVEMAHRVLKRFGTPEFFTSLIETGLGDNPELVRCFHRIGLTMKEDRLIHPGPQAGGEKPIEDIFYPKKAN